MSPWLIRGLGMAVLHGVASSVLAKVQVFQPTDVTVVQIVALAVLVGVAAFWSAVDAWFRRVDRGRDWFIAALVAGPVAGVLNVIGRSVFVDQTGLAELWPALTGGAAFTALLVLVPAGLGLLVGGRLNPPAKTAPEESALDESTPEEPADAGETEPEPRPKPKPRPRPVPRDKGGQRASGSPTG